MSTNGRTLHGGREPYLAVPKSLVRRSDLSAIAKLAWASIYDRLGDNLEAWPGIRKLAVDLGCDPKTVLRAVLELEGAGVIEVVRPGNGRSNRYRFTVGASGALQDRQRSKGAPGGVPGMGAEALPLCPHNSSPLNDPHIVDRGGLFGSDRVAAATPLRATRPRWTQGDIEAIYGEYPRKVGKSRALGEIARALKRVSSRPDAPDDPVAFLVDRVRVFASSPAGQAGIYTPHPSTWFHQGRFDDDDREWQRNGGRNGSSPARCRVEDTVLDGYEESLPTAAPQS